MTIRKAKQSDTFEVFYLLQIYKKEMNVKGCLYIDLFAQNIQSEIEKDQMFLYFAEHVCLGMISFYNEYPPGHDDIKWSASSKPLYIKHIVVHPNWQKHLIENQLFEFMIEYSKTNGYTSVRLDVCTNNRETMLLCQNYNFQQLGQIKLAQSQASFYCFEKTF